MKIEPVELTVNVLAKENTVTLSLEVYDELKRRADEQPSTEIETAADDDKPTRPTGACAEALIAAYDYLATDSSCSYLLWREYRSSLKELGFQFDLDNDVIE